MKLNVFVSDQLVPVDVPDDFLAEAEAFFTKMDADLDQGWQMGRVWLDNPNTAERCRIAADKLLTAIEKENQPMIGMMAGYILKRMPGVSGIRVATDGELQETEFIMQPQAVG